MLRVTADSAEDNLQTGLKYINAISVGMISCSTGTALAHIGVNSNSTGVATPGILGISGVTSGDVFDIICYGR
jgi:hypothetical protein